MGFLFSLMAKLGLDKSEYDSGIDGAKKSASTFAQVLGANLATKGIGLVTKGLANASKKMIGFAKDSGSTGMEFDAAMAQVAATMGKTVGEIKDLKEYAQKMGATTKFTATESANALNYMALAGYDADMSMKMLPNVLNLAAAGNMDLAAASDMVTDSQSALGLSTEETTALVDKMAKASSKSNTSVAQLGEAILTVGGTAKNVKGGTTALATALGILADNGIKGAEGGTALRNIINTLAAPTGNAAKRFEALGVKVFDSTGNMRGLNEVFGDLDASMSTLTQEQRMEALSDIFNVRDLKSAEALLANYGDRWDELSASIDDAQGAAQKMADTQLDNLQGDITLMESAVDGAKLSLSKGLTPALRDVVQRITRYVSSSKAKKFLQEVGTKLGDIVKFIVHKVGVALPRLGRLFTDGGKKVKIFGVALATATVVVKSATNWVGALSSAMGVLVGAMGISALTSERTFKSVAKLTNKNEDLVATVSDSSSAYEELDKAYKENVKSIDTQYDKTQDLWKELQTLADESGNVKDADKERADFLVGELNDALGTEYTMNGNIIQNYKDMQTEIDKLIQKKRAEAKLEAYKPQYQEAVTKQDEAMQSVTVLQDQLKDQQGKTIEARKAWEKAVQEQKEAESGWISKIPSFYGRLAASSVYMRKSADARIAYIAAKESEDAIKASLSDAKATADKYTATISWFEQAQDYLVDGSKQAVEAAEDLLSKGVYAAERLPGRSGALSSMSEEAEIIEGLKNTISAYKQGLDAGLPGYTIEKLEEYNELLEKHNALYAEAEQAVRVAQKAEEEAITLTAKGLHVIIEKKKRDLDEYRINYEAGVEGYTEFELKEQELEIAELERLYQQKINSAKNSAEKIGENIALGLARGMKTKEYAVNNAARNLGQTAINQMKAVPQVASPSKVTTRIGRFIGQGLANGMRDEIGNVERAADELASSALSAPNSAYYSGSGNYTGGGRSSRDGRESGILGEVVALLKDIRNKMSFSVVFEDGTMAGRIDSILGRTAALKARGN